MEGQTVQKKRELEDTAIETFQKESKKNEEYQ